MQSQQDCGPLGPCWWRSLFLLWPALGWVRKKLNHRPFALALFVLQYSKKEIDQALGGWVKPSEFFIIFWCNLDEQICIFQTDYIVWRCSFLYLKWLACQSSVVSTNPDFLPAYSWSKGCGDLPDDCNAKICALKEEFSSPFVTHTSVRLSLAQKPKSILSKSYWFSFLIQ